MSNQQVKTVRAQVHRGKAILRYSVFSDHIRSYYNAVRSAARILQPKFGKIVARSPEFERLTQYSGDADV